MNRKDLRGFWALEVFCYENQSHAKTQSRKEKKSQRKTVTTNVALFTQHGYEKTRIKSFLNAFVSSWQKRAIGANDLSSYAKRYLPPVFHRRRLRPDLGTLYRRSM